MHVSVVVPVFNGAKTVCAALDSIVAQTFSDWDIVVVDDGSEDNTLILLQEYTRRCARIQVLQNVENKGLPTSLNRGWRHASGPLIARMDADDISTPDRLERQVGFLTANPEISVLGGAAEFVSASGHRIGLCRRPESHEEIAARMYWEIPFIHPSVMVRKAFYTEMGGYDESLVTTGEDNDLWLRGYRRFRYANLPAVLVRYTAVMKQSFKVDAERSYVLARAAVRERAIIPLLVAAPRPLLAHAARRLGVRLPNASNWPLAHESPNE
jgi:glycosyltransferase involved in cell wall biosynthesis